MASSTIPAGGGGGLQPKYQKFTSSGTFTLPDGYGAAKPLLVNIQVIGGGGGGARGQIYNFVGPNNYTMGSYFGQNITINGVNNPGTVVSNISVGGGSGGLCSSQLYLTSNLTITVGAAGARGAQLTGVVTGNASFYSDMESSGVPGNNYTATAGGDGGTTTAGSLAATGGLGTNGYKPITFDRSTGVGTMRLAGSASQSVGNGGSPAGQAGGATPVLGTIAGGSANTTPIYGSFGVGGKQGDGATTTGVEGSGAGMESIGATGAVILTWWQ